MKETALSPFGLCIDVAPNTPWEDLDIGAVKRWIADHRVVVIRGLAPLEPEALAAASRTLGPLQPWSFGAVHELKRDPKPDNYLYTEHAVPLHWDGAFADAVPAYLVFRCVAAPPPGAGGETVFVDTIRVLERASENERERWARARVRYSTEKKAHYGGSFTSPVVGRHPLSGASTIRYAEPVDDLNPVTVEPLDLPPPLRRSLMTELREALYDPEVLLALPWRRGDVVIADNHALLHGRKAFTADAPRHLLRVNVLGTERRWWWSIRDSWRLRRPEFIRAEIPILVIPATLSARSASDLFRTTFFEAVLLFFLLFNIGDLVNCLLDRDVDLHRKTHLSEAVHALGPTHIKIQIALSSILAGGLGLHLALSLRRPWMAAAVVCGIVLGASYTAPPLRMKSRGLFQLAAYVGLLFVGPMVLVSGIFLDFPTPEIVLASLAFGTMQTGVLLVNTAEDLDEDEREGVRTVAVVLQASGTMRLARWLTLIGGISFAGIIAAALLDRRAATSSPVSLVAFLALVPLAAAVVYNERWIRELVVRTTGLAEAAKRELIRKQGRYVPRHIEATAWTALLAAIAVLAARALG